MLRKSFFTYLKEYFVITVGCLIYAISLNYFFITNNLAEGGVAGICLIIFYLFKLPVSITYFIINIPLLLIAWRLIGREFLVKTLYGTACVSIFIWLTQEWKGPVGDLMLGAIYGGALAGVGLGLIFMVNGSTGGTDIVAIILKKYIDIPIGRTIFSIDIIILIFAGLIFGKVIVMYTLIAMLIASKAIDYFQDGIKKSKGVTIISKKSEELRIRIMEESGRGTTIILAEGGYSRQSLPIVYCVVSKFEIGKIKNIVRDVDPTAFVTISDVSEVLGEGFSSLKNQ